MTFNGFVFVKISQMDQVGVGTSTYAIMNMIFWIAGMVMLGIGAGLSATRQSQVVSPARELPETRSSEWQ